MTIAPVFLLGAALFPFYVKAGHPARLQPEETKYKLDRYALDLNPNNSYQDVLQREGLISLSDFFVDGNEPSSIEVKFFSDEDTKTFHKVNENYDGEGAYYYWFGEESNSSGSSLNLLVKRDDSDILKITGSASIETNVYNIITLPNGSIQVREANISTFPREGEAPSKAPNRLLRNSRQNDKFAKILTERDLQEGQDDGSVIDVMCLYTPDALCDEVRSYVEKSGTSCDATNQYYINVMNEKCRLGVEETNISYKSSGVLTSLNLVYSGLIDTEYEELSGNICDTLDLMRSSNDATYRRIRQLRDIFGADLVTLMVGDKSWCGCGDTFDGNSLSAFSVVNNRCATGYYSFAHEIGHALGCEHNRNPGLTGYGYGYQNPDGKFRTIMSYNCDSSCPRIQRFSTPNNSIRYTGLRVGTDVHDNVRKINENRFTVANFRSSVQKKNTSVPTPRPSPMPTQKSYSSPITPLPIPTWNTQAPHPSPLETDCQWNKVELRIELETDGITTQQAISWTLKNRVGETIADSSSSTFSSGQIPNQPIQGTFRTCIVSGNCYSFQIIGTIGKYRYKVYANEDLVLSGDNSNYRSIQNQNFSLDSLRKRYWMGVQIKRKCKWLRGKDGDNVNRATNPCDKYRVVREGCPVTCRSCPWDE